MPFPITRLLEASLFAERADRFGVDATMPRRGWLWTAWYLWALFLLVVLISSQSGEYGQFGYDNLRRLMPGAQAMGNAVASVGDALGLDFSSVSEFFDDLWVGPRGLTPFVNALVIVGCWAFISWLLVSVLSFVLRGVTGGTGGTTLPTLNGGDVVTQRVLAIVVVVFLCVLFAPGWPIEGPVFRVLNDRSIDPMRERESAAIQDELDREVQDWAPADLSPACQLVMTEGPNQLEARSDPSLLRTCGESVKSALEADATMGREPDPRSNPAPFATYWKFRHWRKAANLTAWPQTICSSAASIDSLDPAIPISDKKDGVSQRNGTSACCNFLMIAPIALIRALRWDTSSRSWPNCSTTAVNPKAATWPTGLLR
jgi:hypothetical protein